MGKDENKKRENPYVTSGTRYSEDSGTGKLNTEIEKSQSANFTNAKQNLQFGENVRIRSTFSCLLALAKSLAPTSLHRIC